MITDIVIVVAAALLIGVYVSWRAGRIDEVAGDYTHQVFARAIVHSSRL